MESRASLTLKPSTRRCAGLAPRRAASQACRAPRSARPTRCQATQASGGKVSFRLQQQVPFKTYFKVCGNVEELGAWDLEKAPMMEWSEGDVWSVDVTIPAGVDVEYKVVKVPRREPIAWESGPNRSLQVPDSELILKMAFDSADATEVVSVPSEEEDVIVAEPPSVDDPLKPVEEIVAEKVTESAAAKKEVLEEVAEQIAEEIKEEAAQGVDMEKIVEGVTESAADAKDAVSKKATASSKGSKTTGKSSPSGATVAAASVVDEEKNKKNIFGGLFGGFGKK